MEIEIEYGPNNGREALEQYEARMRAGYYDEYEERDDE